MASIIRRKERSDKPVGTALWDPFTTMRQVMQWDPFQVMAPLFAEERPAPAFMPDFDVKETADSFVFKADLPGVKEEALEINLTGKRLSVSGTREEEKEHKDETFYSCERAVGHFSRSFTLPDGADTDHINADLRDGVLKIVVPKEPQSQPRRVQIKGATKIHM